MLSKKTILNGGIILLVCLACVLPVVAIELNPLSYFGKQPVAVHTLNKTIVKQTGIAPMEMVTVLPRVTGSASPVNIPTMSQVYSGTGTCTQDSPITTLDGTITEIMYADTWGTSNTVMKLSEGSEVLLFPADGGDRARVNHLFETAYIKGNKIRVTTTGGCSMVSFSGYDGINKQYPAYKVLFIDLGPVHP
jgi:hypothetical protein